MNDLKPQIISELEQTLKNAQRDLAPFIQQLHIDRTQMAEAKEKQENAIDLYVGTKTGGIVKVAMDKVITNNKKLSIHKVKVIFENIETEEPTEIKELKSKIDDFKQYEVSYEYDDDGYVTEMVIEKY